ncbi:ATP-binding cassette domain-containing protein [Tumebacillus flagellatus]|uniref:ABC transporter ATP-binding protein n=1 Tax=Tumebacillus flagellatus TaxID=1157490 RepID=A0A074LVV4_9BACL|nr:ABC transporter ATP-binding protein [Tumebacillus flagellatus]KEO84158.1 hypothetical protein EL26_06745 [Tumebacillus flagellatus]
MRQASSFEKIQVCARLIQQADPRQSKLFYSCFAVYTALVLFEPFGMRAFLNRWGDGTESMLSAIGFLTAIMLLRQLFGTVELLARTRLQDALPPLYERKLAENMQRLSLEQAEDAGVQDLLFKSKRLNLAKAGVNAYSVLCDALSLAVILVLVLVFGNGLAAGMVLLFTAWGVYAQTVQTKRTADLVRAQGSEQRLLDRLFRLGIERESHMEIRVLSANDFLRKRWKQHMNMLVEALASRERQAAWRTTPPVLVYFFLQALLAAFVGWGVIREGGTAGDFVFLFTLVNLFGDLATGFSGKLNVLIRDARMAEDLWQFLNLPAGLRPKAVTQPLPEKNAVVSLRNISYRYPNADRAALQEIDLTIYEGETLAIVGEMGSGKSTLVKVLAGLLPVETGEVVWNAETVALGATFPVTSVFQDFNRFHMTVQENIGLGHLADLQNKERMKKLLQDLGLPHDLEFLQKQLGTEFGGEDLSGGQWQRVAIARALLKPHRLVTFDEPTAALDPKAEVELIELFLRLAENQAKLIVTHRLAAVKKADRSVVMERGRIVEIGTHEQLMSRDSRYRDLFESQASWYAEEVPR